MKVQKPVFLFAFANDDKKSLHLDEEWRQAERALQTAEDRGQLVFNLTPSVTSEDIFEKFNRFHNQIAIFHYGGHSNGEALHLVDRPLMDKSLATLVGQEKAIQLVFLNGCSNERQVEALFEQGVPAVIATAVPINDHRALHLSKQFYQALTSGRTIQEAFAVAAEYVNNSEAKGLVAYRSLGKGKGKENRPFEWGLYVNKDRSVLEWSLSKVTGKIEDDKDNGPANSSRIKTILFTFLLLLFVGFITWQFSSLIPIETAKASAQNTRALLVNLHGVQGYHDIPLRGEGNLFFSLHGERYTASINGQGQARFEEVLFQDTENVVRFFLNAEAFKLIDSNSINLQDIESLDLRIVPKTTVLAANESKKTVTKDREKESKNRPEEPDQDREETSQPVPQEPEVTSTPTDTLTSPSQENEEEATVKMVKVRCRTRGKGNVKVWFYYEGKKYEETSIAGEEDLVFEVPSTLTEKVKVTTVYYKFKDYEDHRPQAFSTATPFEIPLSVRNRE